MKKRTKYIIIDSLSGNKISDVDYPGIDTWKSRKEAIGYIQNPNNIYGDRYILKVEGKSQELTLNEVWDEYEFKKYGRAKGKWIGMSPKSKSNPKNRGVYQLINIK